ncbi:MAG: tetratricopeptide repeat protein [Candidatus Omnitrophica bacterium]|nr:tetratricopeptide repeat protein [Candidatus Omnitrophota bacterium]
MRYLVILTIYVLVLPSMLYADICIMKDKTKLKGLVVEEYSDRVLLNTVDGEKDILRKDIERIEYDTPEQNFMQLGRAYEEKGWYDKAAFYYKKAMELNPGYKDAREAYLACHAKTWRQEEQMTRKEIEHRSMVIDWRKNRNNKIKPPAKDKRELLRDRLGVSLVRKDGFFAIIDVRSYSSADKAGVRKGDILAGIWGKLIRYKEMDEILDELLGPKYSEVRVLIERDVSIPIEGATDNLYKNLGVVLGFEYEGLMVKDVMKGKSGESAGLKKRDYILAIDKNITRYLPLDSIMALINGSSGNKEIIFSIRRSVNLRREGEL